MTLGDRLTAVAASRAALVLAGLWGFAEATLFFVVPDVWLGFVAIFAPRRALSALAATLVGALLGALALAVVSPLMPDLLATLFARLPAISVEDLHAVAAAVAERGPVAFVESLFQGRPIKLIVHAAARAELPLPGVLAMVLVNRLLRVGLVTGLLALVGLRFEAVVHRHPLATLVAYGAGVVAVYAYLWFFS